MPCISRAAVSPKANLANASMRAPSSVYSDPEISMSGSPCFVTGEPNGSEMILKYPNSFFLCIGGLPEVSNVPA